MSFHLVVTRPFGGMGRGAIITDAAKIGEVQAGEHALHVVRVAAQAGAKPPAPQAGKRGE